jgi:hypothetical protein
MRIFFPFREMMADPVPKIGTNEWLPIRTLCPEHGRYDIKPGLVRNHIVIVAGVCKQKACTRSLGLRESLDGVCWRVVKEGHHMFRERDSSNAFRIDHHLHMIYNRKGLASDGGEVDNLQGCVGT